MKKEWISVVVPVYNVKKYLDKCIESILRQTYARLEIILVDDGSTDGSGEICDKFAAKDQRIRVLHQENAGRSGARNRGLKEASGTYLMFVDGDDWIDEICLERAYDAVKKYQAQMAVFRGRDIYYDHIEDGSTAEEFFFRGDEPLQFYVEGRDGFQSRTAVWGKLYQKELLNDIRFVENKYYEDVMFMTKVYARCISCVYLNQAYYNYNIDTEGSITAVGVNELTFRDEIPIWYEKEEFIRNLGKPDLAERYSFAKFKRLLQYYCDCVDAGEREYAGRIARIINQDKADLKQLLNREYVSKYYRLCFGLFLLQPRCAYWFIQLMKKIYDKKEDKSRC